jgi:thymidine phosphorylase
MTLLTQDIIRLKRDGKTLEDNLINDFIDGITKYDISDAQIAAFCMASFLRGLNFIECAALTRAMAHSGTVLKWQSDDRPVIDKHSTGGVGDKVSLMLAPLAAACGLRVPMIAGRGLGHTGGTIDKLEAITGFQTALSIEQFQALVNDLGCAIIGQTASFAPADKRLYAVRDVTATVESIPLITASILSKKCAAGLQGLVLDVKYGNGAFMVQPNEAESLAENIKQVGHVLGLPVTPILTDMNWVLGHAAGNAVEVIEAIDYLTGAYRDPKLHDVTMRLCDEMLLLGGLAKTQIEARQIGQSKLDSGAAYQFFEKMVAAQQGDLKNIPKADHVFDIIAHQDGVLRAMDVRAIGQLLVSLKAGRRFVEDKIDPRIGLTNIASCGTICVKGQTRLAQIHLTDPNDFKYAQQTYCTALQIKG